MTYHTEDFNLGDNIIQLGFLNAISQSKVEDGLENFWCLKFGISVR